MFIQCQHCQSNYQIDEHKIPEQNAFVRCAKCSNPIPLDIKEQSALTLKQPKKIVSCENCGTRYSIPIEKFEHESLSVRCGKCEHLFTVEKSEIGEEETTLPAEDLGMLESEMDPEENVDLNSISIPEENEIEVDGLFDNIEETNHEELEDDLSDDYLGSDDFSDEDDFIDEDSSMSSTQDYLDSVSLEAESEDDDVNLDEEADFELDEISDDDRSKLFLKPESNEATSENDWPEIQDETELSDSELEPAEFADLDDLSESDDEDFQIATELQQINEGSGRAKVLIIALIVILILAALSIGGWFLYKDKLTQTASPVSAERFSEKSKIAILEPLKGKLLENWESGKKVFVLSGKVINNYSAGTRIRWIQVKGVLYDNKGEVISEALGVAGKSISNEKIVDWTPGRLISYIEELASIQGPDLAMDAGQVEPFQIIFYDVPDNIQKLEARIKQFSKIQSP